jgi:hypothetical protein
MRRITIALLTLAVAGTLAADDRRIETFSFDATSLARLELEHAVGDLEIVDTPGNTVEVVMTAHCDGWRCDVDDIELVARTSGRTLLMEVDGYPRFGGDVSVDLEIRMPAHLALEIERGVGSTEIRGITGDIEVEAGVGEIEIEADSTAFRSASAEAGVGDADVRVAGRRIRASSSFVGEESSWQEGEGSSRIDLEVGVGSVDIRLR